MTNAECPMTNEGPDAVRHSAFGIRHFPFFACLLLFTACASRDQSSAPRAAAARALFDETTRQYHVPSSTAEGAERARLQEEAARRYAALVKKFPEQSFISAQALRSLGNIRAAQTNLDAAVKHYAAVGGKYPTQDWEVLQAWKSAADLLWDAGRRDEARHFYRQIVARFDRPDATMIVRTVVRGSQARLREGL